MGWQDAPAVGPDPYWTRLSGPKEERAFQEWKRRYAPNDSGQDYDLRGAFKAGLAPDAATGHWPDTFKKPNHPTFSNESMYAAQRPEMAGSWTGENYQAAPLWASAPALIAEAAPEASPAPLSGRDVATMAAANVLPSAKQFGTDMYNVVRHPVKTLNGMADLLAGGIEKLVPGRQRHEETANAVGRFFKDRYGGWENIKRTAATDPVGILSDASMVLTGGAGLALRAAKAGGTASRSAKAVGNVGRAIDPVTNVMRVGRAALGAGADALGVTTGVGGGAIRTAAQAGMAGGRAGEAFRENMRGAVPVEDVIGDAKVALQSVKKEREAAYNAGMSNVASNSTILDFSKIEADMLPLRNVGTMTGKHSGVSVDLDPNVAPVKAEIDAVMNQWKSLPAQDFHTAEGLDALKQRIGDIVEAQQHGSRTRAIATQAYNTVRRHIATQAPEYAKTMADYEEMSKLIREIEGTLSLNRNARIDTQLRKLQSVTRNNVNTSYGYRSNLAKILADAGANNLLERLAGQSLNQWAPRGLARAGTGTAVTGLASFAYPQLLPLLLGQMAGSSPRIVGEAAYKAGQAARLPSKVPVTPIARGIAAVRQRQERTRPQR